MSYFRPMIVDLLKSASYAVKKAQGWEDPKKHLTFKLPSERKPVELIDDYKEAIKQHPPRYWTAREVDLKAHKEHIWSNYFRSKGGTHRFFWRNVEFSYVTPYTLLYMYNLMHRDKSPSLGTLDFERGWLGSAAAYMIGDMDFRSYKSFRDALEDQQAEFDDIFFHGSSHVENIPLRYVVDGEAVYLEDTKEKYKKVMESLKQPTNPWSRHIRSAGQNNARHALKLATDLLITPLPKLKNMLLARADHMGAPPGKQQEIARKFDRWQREHELLYSNFFDLMTSDNGPLRNLPVDVKKYIVAIKIAMAREDSAKLAQIEKDPEFGTIPDSLKTDLKLITMYPDLIFNPNLAGRLNAMFDNNYGILPFGHPHQVAAILKVEPTLAGLSFASALTRQFGVPKETREMFDWLVGRHLTQVEIALAKDVIGQLSVLPSTIDQTDFYIILQTLEDHMSHWINENVKRFRVYSTKDLHMLRNASAVVGTWAGYRPQTNEVITW